MRKASSFLIADFRREFAAVIGEGRYKIFSRAKSVRKQAENRPKPVKKSEKKSISGVAKNPGNCYHKNLSAFFAVEELIQLKEGLKLHDSASLSYVIKELKS